MTTSLQSILSENYQENRDYELEEKIISCFKSDDEKIFLEIQNYLPIRNEALIANIIDIPGIVDKISYYEKQNNPLIDWSNVVCLFSLEMDKKVVHINSENITTKFITLIEMGHSDYIINMLKQQDYNPIEFFEKINHHTAKISLLFKENKEGKNNIFDKIEHQLNVKFDRANLCMNLMYQSLLDKIDYPFPYKYKKFKLTGKIFEINEGKELINIWEKIQLRSNQSMIAKMNLMKFNKSYIETKEKINEDIIREEQHVLNEILSVNANTIKKRI